MAKAKNETTTASKGSTSVMPEPLPFKLTGSSLTINTTCGTCKHFRRIPHPAYGEICAAKGIFDTNKPCTKYSVDSSQLGVHSDKLLQEIAELMAKVPKKQLVLVSALANRESRTRKYGFYFGQTVYVRLLSSDYISNYRRAIVTEANKDYVYISDSKQGFTMMVYHSSVLTNEQWLEKKAQLKKAKKIVDPKYAEFFKAPTKAEREANKILDTLTPPDLSAIAGKGKKVLLAASEEKRRVLFNNKEVDPDTTPIDKLIGKTNFRVRG